MSIRNQVVTCLLGTAMVMALAACSQQGATPTASANPGASATAPAAPGAALPGALKITGYGPDSTQAGVAFNAQPDGGAALWIRVDQPLDGDEAAVDFNGTLLQGNVSGNLVTAGVPAALYAKAGTFSIHVIARKGTQSVQSNDVKFTVK